MSRCRCPRPKSERREETHPCRTDDELERIPRVSRHEREDDRSNETTLFQPSSRTAFAGAGEGKPHVESECSGTAAGEHAGRKREPRDVRDRREQQTRRRSGAYRKRRADGETTTPIGV
jgi:hypothetical protein